MDPKSSESEVTIDVKLPQPNLPRDQPEGPVPDIKALRQAIPEHCFQPSTVTTLSYIARDLTLVTGLFWLATGIPEIENCFLRSALWAAYGLVQGFVFTGIWILAHECGHEALFPGKKMNACFGLTLHSFLLVPFFSWKYTHARHHRYTNHMEKDTAFVPAREGGFSLQDYVNKALGFTEDAPLMAAIVFLGHQLLGWPLYQMLHLTAGARSRPNSQTPKFLRSSHLDPGADIFSATERPYVLVSDLGLLVMGSALAFLSQQFGFSSIALIYLVPWLWVNHWIVAITFLHHTHPEIPHFESDTWTFQKGALSTVDRDLGFIGRHLFHGIIECHVIHHLFPRIPFYHAEEATERLQTLLGSHYKKQETSFLRDLWSTFTQLKYVKSVDDRPGVLMWFGNGGQLY